MRDIKKRSTGRDPIIPDKLMIEYLMHRFDMTPNRARKPSTTRAGSTRRKTGVLRDKRGLARYNDLTKNSKIMQQCRAFRVACEFCRRAERFPPSCTRGC